MYTTEYITINTEAKKVDKALEQAAILLTAELNKIRREVYDGDANVVSVSQSDLNSMGSPGYSMEVSVTYLVTWDHLK